MQALNAEQLRQLKATRAQALLNEVNAVARSIPSAAHGIGMYGCFPMLSKQPPPQPRVGGMGMMAGMNGMNGGFRPMNGPSHVPPPSSGNNKRRRVSRDDVHGASALLSLSPLNSPALSCCVSVLATPDLLALDGAKSSSPPPQLDLPVSGWDRRDRALPSPVPGAGASSTATVSPPPTAWQNVDGEGTGTSPTPEKLAKLTVMPAQGSSLLRAPPSMDDNGCSMLSKAPSNATSTLAGGGGGPVASLSAIPSATLLSGTGTSDTMIRKTGSFSCLDILETPATTAAIGLNGILQ